ncbi:MAG: hypothetical protein RQ824_12300 [bacterium]|nr:hypothetical protein [bacterium]
MTSNYLKVFLLFWSLGLLAGCGSGARAILKFDGTKYPVSMSAFLYDSDYKVVAKDKELEVIAQFKHEKRFWGIFYTIIALSNDDEVVAAINREVSNIGGDGIINLSVTAYNCLFNSFPIISLAPIMPGCVDTVVMGEIVKLKDKALSSTPKTANYIQKKE